MKTPHKPKLFRHLNVQISFYFVTASLILVALLGGVLYYSLSGIILNKELQNTVTSVERSGNYIEVYIDKLKALAHIIADSPDTLTYLATRDPEARARVLSLIGTTLSTDSSLVSVVLVSKDGDVLSNEKSLDMTVSADMMHESWYVAALNNAGMPALISARQQTFSMDKSNWVISVSKEITETDGGNAGVLLLDIRYQVIEDYLSGINLGNKGFAFILDNSGGVVYHPEPEYFQDPVKKNKLIEISRMPDGYDRGMGMLTDHYAIAGTHWTLVGISSLDGLASVRRQLMETFVVAAVILFGIVLGGGTFFAGKVTNPIRELEQAMESLEEGLARVKVDEGGCYEAESLARHYNMMLERIEALMTSITEKEKELRTYEINALHSQINPHFLYNTLDTIVWMAEFNDSDKVIAVTKSLAQFFRLSLSKGEELIPLEDELDHVKQYLFIQEQRYGDKFSCSFSTDQSLYSVKVPKIILQPIVENAIYHGIRELEGKGHIQITARRQGENLVLVVADTGVGFMEAAVKSGDKRLSGVGIANVDRRIKLHFGERFGIKVESAVGKGTTVTLTLPIFEN